MNTTGFQCCIAAVTTGLLLAPAHAQVDDGPSRIRERAWEHARERLEHAVHRFSPTEHPQSTLDDGTWMASGRKVWTSGFFSGCLWLLFEQSEDPVVEQWARDWTADLESQKDDRSNHDVGFQILSSFGNGLRLTGDTSYPPVIQAAAASLASRFDPDVGCTRSWSWGSWSFPVIIDNMMNLELLFQAAAEGGDPLWRDMAIQHAERTMLEHVRDDGSCYQIVDFDPDDGSVLYRGSWQGYADETTWSRGQAWGIHGFAIAYRFTGDVRFLRTAESMTDYFVRNLPPDRVPYWDFEAPGIPDEPRDSSAAAIAASGMLELARYLPTARGARIRAVAESILDSLLTHRYRSENQPFESILLHATGDARHGLEVDVGLIQGDYYFLQALLRSSRR